LDAPCRLIPIWSSHLHAIMGAMRACCAGLDGLTRSHAGTALSLSGTAVTVQA
jgi:hypothetical protein